MSGLVDERINHIDKFKFLKELNYLNTFVKDYNNGRKVSMIVNALKCVLFSKYHRRQIINMIKYKFTNKE